MRSLRSDKINEFLEVPEDLPNQALPNIVEGQATRTWQNALDMLVATKRAGSANRDRWETFAKNKGLKPLMKLVLLETRADQLLSAVVNHFAALCWKRL